MLPFDSGTRELGYRVKPAFYAQHQLEDLNASRSVFEELESVARYDDHSRLRGHLGAFLFSGDDIQKKVSVLSGGEKARLALAKMLLRPSNFLVLDEPTNHLDVVACEVLEGALRDYEGSAALHLPRPHPDRRRGVESRGGEGREARRVPRHLHGMG